MPPLSAKSPSRPFTYPCFKRYGIIAATSLRTPDGNLALHTGGPARRVISNRKKFFDKFGIDYRRILCLDQVHGSRVVRSKNKDCGKGSLTHKDAIRGDAVISDIPGLPIVIFTADCVPVLAYDPKKKVCGLIHAGWKGAQKKILKKTLDTMIGRYACKAGDIILTNGPYIAECCYRVGDDFLRHFPARFFQRRKNGYYFDLLAPLRKQAQESGISNRNIKFNKTCTSCDPLNFYSYRNGHDSKGRMATFMMVT